LEPCGNATGVLFFITRYRTFSGDNLMAKHPDAAEDKKLIRKEIKSAKLTFSKGGVTSAAMKKVGRNMARANNQRGR
jgi:hypothetical protein